MPLSAGDYKRLLNLVHLVNSIPDKRRLKLEFYKELQKLINFDSACTIFLDTTDGSLKTDDPIVFNHEEEGPKIFCERYAPTHPLVQSGFHKIVNESLRLTDVISSTRLRDSEYSSDFQSKFNIFYELCSNLGQQGDIMALMGLHKEKGSRDFTEREREIFKLLLPHVSGALHRIDLLENISLYSGEGVVYISSGGAVSYMNAEASRILNGKPISALPMPDSSGKPLTFKNNGRAYRVRRVKSNAAGIEEVIFIDSIPSSKRISSMLAVYGLSERQADVGVMVVKGYSNKEIAEEFSISELTVRDHIKDIFEKTKVHSRSEFTAKVLGLRKM